MARGSGGLQRSGTLPEHTGVLQQPLGSVYLAATSAMDLFRALDASGSITLSGTDASGWYSLEAKAAMETREMAYTGKYSAPDYELILSKGCDLAVESTMIYHPRGQGAVGAFWHTSSGGTLQL